MGGAVLALQKTLEALGAGGSRRESVARSAADAAAAALDYEDAARYRDQIVGAVPKAKLEAAVLKAL